MTRQSGTSLNGESRSRRGNHRLKNAMFPAARRKIRRALAANGYLEETGMEQQ